MLKTKILIFFVCVFILASCGRSSETIADPTTASDTETLDSDYSNETSSIELPKTFNGYECTSDCSGHEAGYNWAEENDIDDPDDCGGNSESFIEGCQSYAEEQQGEEAVVE